MKKFLLYLFTYLLVQSCANIKPPTGGEEDNTSPELIGSNPEHKSTNFKGDRITLEFDEPIESKNLFKELIISPSNNIEYKEKPSKTSITLKLKDTLNPNTTYTFNFGNAIIDLTEKNPAKNAKIAFSTGSYIDTAYFQGRVIDMFTQLPIEDVVVVLAPNNDTFDIEKNKPLYVTRVDSGYFSLENLPDSNFIIYAIQDVNGSFTYNPGQEKIARFPDILKPTHTDTSLIELTLASQNTKPFELTYIDHYPQYSVIKLSKGLEHHNIKKDTFTYLIQENQQHFYLFHNLPHGDSLTQMFSFMDSIGQKIDSLLVLKSDTAATKFDKKFTYIQRPDKADIINYIDSLRFNFNISLKTFNQDSILIILDNQDSIVNASVVIDKVFPSEYFIRFPFEYRQSININIPFGNIISIFDDTLPKQSINITLPTEENTGRISGTIKTEKTNIIIQLINKGDKVIRTTYTDKQFDFPFLPPDNYRIRAIEDLNNNGRWDAGDYRINLQPESVFYYDETIQVKANWIQEGKLFEF